MSSSGRTDLLTSTPPDAARNLVQPSADVPAMTLKAPTGTPTSPVLKVTDNANQSQFEVTPDGDVLLRDTGAGHGPMVLHTFSKTFNAILDPDLFLGYNMTHDAGGNGVPVTAGEPYLVDGYEADYHNGTARFMERYTEAQVPNGGSPITVRSDFTMYARAAATSAALVALRELRAAQIDLMHSDSGQYMRLARITINSANAAQLSVGTTSPAAGVVGHFKSPGVCELRIEGGRAWRLGAPQVSTDDFTLSTTAVETLRVSTAGQVKIGGGAGMAAATIPLSVMGINSQAGNIAEFGLVTTPYVTVSENGYLTTRRTAAPADAELAAGEQAFWLDATNGAAKFMVKAKEAGGTVRTGSLALA